MIRNTYKMNRLLFFLAIASFGLALIFVPIAKAQGTYTAASCNETDVANCANGVSCSGGSSHKVANGDVINVPSGICTWTTGFTLPQGTPGSPIGISIIGSGTPNSGSSTTGASSSCVATYIKDAAPSSPLTALFTAAPYYGAGTTRISCMAIDPAQSGSYTLANPIQVNGTCASGGCPQVRIDNITFGNSIQWTSTNNGSHPTELVHYNNAFGVLDHNTAPSGNNTALFVAALEAYLGVGDNGDNSWAQPNSLGGADNVFAENNLWNSVNWALNDCENPLPWGCRFVLRYNNITQSGSGSFGIAENHGTDTTGRARSGREMEVYNNTLNCLSNCSDVDGGIRGGTGLYFNNHANLTPGEGAGSWLGISLYRVVDANASWNTCGGNGPWDQNDNVVYYSGTVTSANGGGLGSTMTVGDSTQNWPNLAPSGYPYSFYDVTQGRWIEIRSSTSNTFTSQYEAHSTWVAAVGDSYQIVRAQYCMDQPGHGIGNYLSGNSTNCSVSFNSGPTFTAGSPCGYPSQALEPLYQWGESFSGGANVNNPIESNSGKVINYRDYYAQSSGAQSSSTSPFACNGTTGGTGWGTLANRPESCSGACSTNTPGCGYFATDQGASGTLYVWESGGWKSYYTPYQYPHPLDSSVNQAATPTISPIIGNVPASITVSDSTGGAIICWNTTGYIGINGAASCPSGSSSVSSGGTVSVTTPGMVYAWAGGSGLTDSGIATVTTVNAPTNLAVTVQ